MNKIQVMILKEWAEVFKNRFVLFAVAFLPLIFTALPLFILYWMRDSGDLDASIPFDGPPQFAQFCVDLTGGECVQYFMISQFMLMFMMLPLIIPITIASYSIVGEKTTRTLEPVLATPITTLELLGGKALAAILPGVVATWGGFLAFAIGTRLMTENPNVAGKLFDPLWILGVFAVGPLLAVAAVSVAVMVSSRVSDPRVAEQLSMLLLLPLLGLFIGQVTGYIFINERIILWMAIGLAVIDVGLVAIATQIFQRETILTRWK